MSSMQPTRRYDSSGRQARAAETRSRIIEAAHRRFVADGYAATTIAAVAMAAEVSTPTVYAGFGTKAQLLKEAIDVALAGDSAAVPVADRPLSTWVHRADTAEELVARYAVMMGELASRAAPIYHVLVRAADSEPVLAALLDDLERQRLRAATILAGAIHDRGGLPAGRTLEEARDVAWICNAPELYADLTTKRRWSRRRYVAWARNTLIKLILEPPRAGQAPELRT